MAQDVTSMLETLHGTVMGWFRHKDEMAPDGSPLSEWEPRVFEPQNDITAYELAVIVKAFKDYSSPFATNPSTLYFRKDQTPWIPIYKSDVVRHFRLDTGK